MIDTLIGDHSLFSVTHWLFTEAYPWKGFHISIISVLLLLPLMTSGQYSNHSVLLGDLCSGEKKSVCRRGWLAGAVVGMKEGSLLWVCPRMMTPLKWRCQCAVSGGNSFQSLTVRGKNVFFLQSVRQQKHWYCRPWLLLRPFLLFQAKAPHTCLHGEFHTSTKHNEISWVASMIVYLLLEFTTTTTLPEMYPAKILYFFSSCHNKQWNYTHDDSVTVYHKYPIVKALRASSFTATTCWPILRFSATPTDLSVTVCLGYMRKTSERLHVEDRRPKQIAMLSSGVGFWFRCS